MKAAVTDSGHVLIIEDDPDMRALEAITLSNAGWEVTEASTGDAGVAAASLLLPDVVVCDRRMPGLDGLGVLAALAADPNTAAIPVVLVTGMADVADVVLGMDAGAHDYLVKPFEMIELVVRCRAALRVTREHRRVAKSEREFRLLADNVSELVTRRCMDGTIRYASPSSRSVLGWEPEELVGRNVRELMHPDDPAPFEGTHGAMSFDSAVTVTLRSRCADGGYVWLESRLREVIGPDGDAEILATHRDVTDRLATATALAESEAAYRRIVDLAAEGIWVVDEDHRVTYANARMGELLGVASNALIGRDPMEFTDDDGRAVAMERIERRRAGIAETNEFRFVRSDGTELWTSINAAPIIEDGVYRGAIGMVSDISARRLQQDALAKSEARYRALLDHMPDTVAIVYDRALNAVVVAGAGIAARGLDAAQMVGRHFTDLVSPVDVPTLRPLYDAAFDGTASTIEFRSHLTEVENLLDVVPIPSASGDPDEILVLARNIAPLKDRERAITEAEERWRAAFESAPVGMAQLGTDGRLRRANQALSALLGYPIEQLETLYANDIAQPADASRVATIIASLARGEVPHMRGEMHYRRADGTSAWALVSVVPIHGRDGNVEHLLAHYLDINDRKRRETELEHLAEHDPLTGLLNRRGFDAELQRHLDDVRRYGPDGALLVIDLDGLKAINDTRGHEAGDALLASVADVLRRRLRSSDIVGRLGGDEFAVIIPHADVSRAELVAGAIVDAIRQHCSPSGGLESRVTASLGVAIFDTSSRTAEEMLALADSCMYAAKTAGGDRHRTGHPLAPTSARTEHEQSVRGRSSERVHY